MIRRARILALLVAGSLLAACQQVSLDDLRQAEGMDEFARLSNRVAEGGEDGIPILLAVIEESLETKYSLFSYGKINNCLLHLRELAGDGIHTAESVHVLVRTIDEQIAISDTLVTAEILTIITGIDPGWDEAFVTGYSLEDEALAHQKIDQWRQWQPPIAGD